MKDLSEIRVDIDTTDSALKELFLKRMELVEQVAEYKKENKSPVRHKEREAQIIKNRTEGEEKFVPQITEFFEQMIEISCDYQESVLWEKNEKFKYTKISESEFKNGVKKVCHQGIKGSYSYEQSAKYFENAEIMSVQAFEDVFKAVSEGDADCGVVPIENITEGSVTQVFDLLNKYEVYIVHSECLEIVHCLLGSGTLEDIGAVSSHPQGLSQCSDFIYKNKYKTVQSLNTAVAARDVAKMGMKGVGAICSEINAELYGLNVLARNIANRNDNKTRFIFIAKNPVVMENANNISLSFKLKNTSGTLSKVLNNFSKHGYNLTKIESRPIMGKEWEYLFYIDIDANLGDNRTAEYFSSIGYLFDEYRILGNYKKD